MISVTILIDEDLLKTVQEEASQNFEGNVSQQVRKIIKDWKDSLDD